MRIFSKLLFVALFLMNTQLFAQDKTWLTEPTKPGTVLIGVGPNLAAVGMNAKTGVFLKGNYLVGINGEIQHAISLRSSVALRKEAGVFARKYVNSDNLSFYLQGGLTYGYFEEWSFNFGDEISPENEGVTHHKFRLNAGAGGEFRLTKRFSLEGEFTYGKIINTPHWGSSIKTSLNYRFLK